MHDTQEFSGLAGRFSSGYTGEEKLSELRSKPFA
jgi:hypothetical protein